MLLHCLQASHDLATRLGGVMVEVVVFVLDPGHVSIPCKCSEEQAGKAVGVRPHLMRKGVRPPPEPIKQESSAKIRYTTMMATMAHSTIIRI